MGFFTAVDLAELRAEQIAAMDTTCAVLTPALAVSDGAGGSTPGTQTSVTVVCRVGNPTALEGLTADRQSQDTDVAITVPYGVAVTRASEITVGGVTYRVVNENTIQSNGVAVRALCERTG